MLNILHKKNKAEKALFKAAGKHNYFSFPGFTRMVTSGSPALRTYRDVLGLLTGQAGTIRSVSTRTDKTKNKIFSKSFSLPALLLGVTLAFMFSSCNKVDKPYLKKPNPIIPTNDTIRKVLIEDFTGHKCSNCPRAAYTIHNFLEVTFPKKVVAIGIHPKGGGGFTTTDANHLEDFRTPVGDKYDTDFGISGNGLPNGMVNRRKNTGGYAISDSKWKDTVTALLKKAPDALLKITNTYDVATRKLTSDVKCSFLNTLSGTYNLVVLLTQDSIKAPQDYNGTGGDPAWHSPTESNYWHMHVLRACISDGTGPASGAGVSIGSIIKGNTVTKSFPFDVPTIVVNVPLDAKHCNVVAFIYNTLTNEVVQVEEKKLM